MKKHNINRKEEYSFKTNNNIKAYEIRLIGKNVEPGIYKKSDAIKIAEDLNLDLILINENQNPPICKIEDYGKMVYEEKKKKKEFDKKNRDTAIELKEIRLTPVTGKGDIEHKLKSAVKFLKEGDKVKFTVQFRGRQMQHQEMGELILLEIAKELSELGLPESMPKMEGKRMSFIIKPRKN
jgi:translation initiation factor IF-3